MPNPAKPFRFTIQLVEKFCIAVPLETRRDIDLAVKAARRAFEQGPWSRLTHGQRGRLIWKLADLIEEHLEEFAQLESLDNGKPLSVARVADVPAGRRSIPLHGGLDDQD
jgi:acyl-CoA reductase-like NAD-dependent aldehyde dehydrogenase